MRSSPIPDLNALTLDTLKLWLACAMTNNNSCIFATVTAFTWNQATFFKWQMIGRAFDSAGGAHNESRSESAAPRPSLIVFNVGLLECFMFFPIEKHSFRQFVEPPFWDRSVAVDDVG